MNTKLTHVFCVVMCVTGILGYAITLYTVLTYTPRIDAMNLEVATLSSELQAAQTSAKETLSQASEIVDRVTYVGTTVADMLNAGASGASVDSFFAPGTASAGVWNQASYYLSGDNARWVFEAHESVYPDKVPMLWEYVVGSEQEARAFASGWYDISTGKVTDCNFGVYVDMLDVSATVEGNSPDYSPE